MKTYYSIVYANIRPSVDERVSIALLLRDENNIIFHYAPEKVDALRLLMPSDAYSLLRVLIRNLDEYIANPEPVNQHFNYKLDIEPFERRFLDKSYISYLATYSNNLVTFSEPKAIDISVTEESFTQLFRKYIHQDWETALRPANRQQSIVRVRRELYPKVIGRVNIDTTITDSVIPGLVAPTKVNLAGRNEVNMVAQVIDFEKKQSYSLEADINRVLALARAFESMGQKDGKYFIIGKEPSKSLSLQHTIWQNISQQRSFEFVPDNETQRVNEYIIDHNVQPLIQEDTEVL